MAERYERASPAENNVHKQQTSKHRNLLHESDEEEDDEPLGHVEGHSSAISMGGLHHTTHKLHHHHDSKASTSTAHGPSAPAAGAHHIAHHTATHSTTSLGLLMLVDGIGLAVITAATVLEGFEFWSELFSPYWLTNEFTLSLWFMGRTSQIIGLIFLIGHASSFQIFPNVERFGMFCLTLGTVLNFTSYCMFRSAEHTSWVDNRAWLSSETLELIGIGILDVSLFDMEEILVLIAEVTGFIILCAAAALQFDYSMLGFPLVSFRLDMIHASECFGLCMLIVVAVCQYQIKVHKHELEMQHQQAQRHMHQRCDIV